MIEVRFYQGKDHFEEPFSVREAVFMQEQGFKDEIDEKDNVATHLVLVLDGKIVACGRYFSDQDKMATIGRIAVLKEARKLHLGFRVMQELENRIKSEGYERIALSAQCQAQGFYERLGYHASGEVYLDEHCPHIHMEKKMMENKLEEARKEINLVDSEMAQLFERRMAAVEKVIEYKMENNLPIYDASREKEVIAKNLTRIQKEELKEYYRQYILSMMNISKEYQEEIRKKYKKEEG